MQRFFSCNVRELADVEKTLHMYLVVCRIKSKRKWSFSTFNYKIFHLIILILCRKYLTQTYCMGAKACYGHVLSTSYFGNLSKTWFLTSIKYILQNVFGSCLCWFDYNNTLYAWYRCPIDGGSPLFHKKSIFLLNLKYVTLCTKVTKVQKNPMKRSSLTLGTYWNYSKRFLLALSIMILWRWRDFVTHRDVTDPPITTQ
jgi:hypothetical protein